MPAGTYTFDFTATNSLGNDRHVARSPLPSPPERPQCNGSRRHRQEDRHQRLPLDHRRRPHLLQRSELHHAIRRRPAARASDDRSGSELRHELPHQLHAGDRFRLHGRYLLRKQPDRTAARRCSARPISKPGDVALCLRGTVDDGLPGSQEALLHLRAARRCGTAVHRRLRASASRLLERHGSR